MVFIKSPVLKGASILKESHPETTLRQTDALVITPVALEQRNSFGPLEKETPVNSMVLLPLFIIPYYFLSPQTIVINLVIDFTTCFHYFEFSITLKKSNVVQKCIKNKKY